MSKDNIPLAGVIGDPIAHSKSPRLHAHWLRRYGIRGHYIPMHVASRNLKSVLETLPKMGFVGVNVTIPHKEAVLTLAQSISDRAAMIGAANTLTFRTDGSIFADNTDGYGFIENIKNSQPTWRADHGAHLVLGAGGAARAVISALIHDGVPEILVANRTKIRAENLKQQFGMRVRVIDWSQAHLNLENIVSVINTTSLGMHGQPPLSFSLSKLEPGTLVNDLVYAPLETNLLAEARAQGGLVVDGLGMLLHQAVPGFERWFGYRPQVDDMLRDEVLR